MIGKFLYDILGSMTFPTGADIVGVYPVLSPQGSALPFVVYGITSASMNDTKNGYSTFDVFSIDINCVASTYDVVNKISYAVRTTLDRYGNYTITGTDYTVDNVQFTNITDAYNEDLKAYIQEMSFDIIVKRS